MTGPNEPSLAKPTAGYPENDRSSKYCAATWHGSRTVKGRASSIDCP